MNLYLLNDLMLCEIDVEGSLIRFSNDEALYLSYLREFLKDRTAQQLGQAIDTQAWDDAFTAAHALKGLTGNLGLIPLFYASAELVVLIRAGRKNEIGASYKKLMKCYSDITAIIRSYFSENDIKSEVEE